jgi:hypothetical protein
MNRLIAAIRFNSIQIKTSAVMNLCALAVLVRNEYLFEDWFSTLTLLVAPWTVAFIANVVDPLPKEEAEI